MSSSLTTTATAAGAPQGGWSFRIGQVRVDIPPLRLLAVPLLMVLILAMMLVPLPPFLLDVLFTFNIVLSLIIMLVTLYLTRPLDFSAFPTALLFTTLLRMPVLSDKYRDPDLHTPDRRRQK